jgi:hypothetical protein
MTIDNNTPLQPDQIFTSNPVPPTPPPSDKQGLAIAALVLGIINLGAWCLPICGLPLAIAGIITGILGLKSSQRVLAIIGLVLSVLGLLLSIINMIAGIALLPMISDMDPSAIEQFFQ